MLIAVLEEVLWERTEKARAIVADIADPREKVIRAIRQPYDWAADPEQVGYAALITREHLRLIAEHGAGVRRAAQFYKDFLAELIRAAQADGAVPADLDATLNASTIADIITTQLHNVVLGLDDIDPSDLADHTTDFCVAALHMQ